MAIEQEEGPPPEIRYRRALHLRTELRELSEARHVIYGLSERDLRSRYSQMFLGFLWNIIGPIALTVVMSVVLSKAKTTVPHDVPRPVWIYTAMIPWGFFSGAVSSGGTSLVSNSALLNKVYVPREVFPISQIATRIVDSTCSLPVLFILFAVYGFMPAWTSFWFVVPFLIALIFTAAVTIIVAGLTVYFRDLRQAIPVLLQLGLFINPIAWDLSDLSANMQKLYVAINPLGGAIDGLRRCVLYGEAPSLSLTLISGTVAIVELCIAYLLFKQMEAGFADVA